MFVLLVWVGCGVVYSVDGRLVDCVCDWCLVCWLVYCGLFDGLVILGVSCLLYCFVVCCSSVLLEFVFALGD